MLRSTFLLFLTVTAPVFGSRDSREAPLIARAREYAQQSEPVPDEFLKQLQSLRNEVDNLYKTLSSRAPLIETPCAFQWAQNATHVLLHVKFTRRWNAPGALEVKNLQVEFSSEGLRLSGEGEHSGNRYLYVLGLNLFSEISPEISRHNFASVGRLMVHMPKKFPNTRWPRLLADASLKLDNMHFWMDMHNKFSDQLEKSAKLVGQSPLTCAADDRKYCPISDSCVADCAAACKAKPEISGRLCVGPPVDSPVVIGNFVDLDPEISFLRGEIRLNVTASPEISGVRVFFGDSGKRKLGSEILQTSEISPDGNFQPLAISAFIPSDSATQFLLVYFNEHGESGNFTSLPFSDFVAPPKPESLTVSGGRVSVALVSDFQRHAVSGVSLVFGKAEGCVRSKTISANLTISDSNFISFDLPPGTRAPLSSTHVLAFARTALGDSVDCAVFPLASSVRGAPKARPASVFFDGRLVRVLSADSADLSVEAFAVYEASNATQRVRLLGHVSGNAGGDFALEEGGAGIAKVCVFAKNYLGEAEEGECAETDSQKTKNNEL